VLGDAHPLVHPAFFRQVPDSITYLGCDSFTEQLDPTGIRAENIEHHSNCGRFACAIRTQKSTNGPPWKLEVEIAHCCIRAKCLIDALKANYGIRHVQPSILPAQKPRCSDGGMIVLNILCGKPIPDFL
jgi:hypothetical protein